uniref:Chromosome segregation in meiosis protein 3 domain-containing protein n=1 Tax=Chenopodium quinoa TaxID=63459 RepID=A0A803LRN6_CHEQI
MSDAGNGGAAPTGCYKCGRPGHCSSFQLKPTASASKPKKVPRTRPKLTPELLLSEQGLGYILRYFPRNFKLKKVIRASINDISNLSMVNDLRNLLRMYAEWHAQLLPYFPFDQFIHKVEEAGSSKRVKETSISRKSNAISADLPPSDISIEQRDQSLGDGGNSLSIGITEEQKSLTEAKKLKALERAATLGDKSMKNSDQSSVVGAGSPNPTEITEDQKSLMEAKRQKALERARARSRLLPAS